MGILTESKNRKSIRKIKKICFESTYFSGCEIYRLLNYKILQDKVLLIKKGNAKLSTSLLFGRKYISNEEKFVYILNKYITFIRDNFHIRTSEFIMILEQTLRSKYSIILYSQLEFNKDDNYRIFYQEFKRMFLEDLFNNYKNFACNEIQNSNYLNISKMSLDNDEDLEKIFELFKEIINYRNNDLYYFFVGFASESNYGEKFYVIKWNNLMNDFLNKCQCNDLIN